MRQPLIAGNWKMNGNKVFVAELLNAIIARQLEVKTAELAVMPPYVYLQQAQLALHSSPIKWGAQDVCAKPDGAFTGEISTSMLQDTGCAYVILGHSERRQFFGDTNSLVQQKCSAAITAKIAPIVCVGETLQEREAQKTLDIIAEQLAAILTLEDNQLAKSGLVIAYEPVWAIGTGKTATPEQAQIVHQAIRQQLKQCGASFAQTTRIIYGGSVKPENAAALFAMEDIDGALIGGAALDANSFIKIGAACNR